MRVVGTVIAGAACRMSEWLTARECDVLLRLAHGDSFKWIGYSLSISEKNVQTSAMRAYRKLGVAGHGRRNREEALLKHRWHEPTPSRACHWKCLDGSLGFPCPICGREAPLRRKKVGKPTAARPLPE